MQVEGLVEGSDCYVGSLGRWSCEERGDVGGERLQRVGRLGVVVRQKQVADSVVQGIVQAALALEGVALTEGTILEQQAYDLVVAAQTGL